MKNQVKSYDEFITKNSLNESYLTLGDGEDIITQEIADIVERNLDVLNQAYRKKLGIDLDFQIDFDYDKRDATRNSCRIYSKNIVSSMGAVGESCWSYVRVDLEGGGFVDKNGMMWWIPSINMDKAHFHKHYVKLISFVFNSISFDTINEKWKIV